MQPFSQEILDAIKAKKIVCAKTSEGKGVVKKIKKEVERGDYLIHYTAEIEMLGNPNVNDCTFSVFDNVRAAADFLQA